MSLHCLDHKKKMTNNIFEDLYFIHIFFYVVCRGHWDSNGTNMLFGMNRHQKAKTIGCFLNHQSIFRFKDFFVLIFV